MLDNVIMNYGYYKYFKVKSILFRYFLLFLEFFKILLYKICAYPWEFESLWEMKNGDPQ